MRMVNDDDDTAMKTDYYNRMISLVLETPSGRRLPLDVKPSDTVFAVKRVIYNNHVAIPPPKQRLVCGDTLLDDHRTIGDYRGRMRDGTVLHLDRMIHISVDPAPYFLHMEESFVDKVARWSVTGARDEPRRDDPRLDNGLDAILLKVRRT